MVPTCDSYDGADAGRTLESTQTTQSRNTYLGIVDLEGRSKQVMVTTQVSNAR
jgi:hypothetical protein